jgi:hypothetical protein
MFSTWELPIEDAGVGREFRIAFDIDPATALLLLLEEPQQVWRSGAPARVGPDSGRLEQVAGCW